MMSGDSAGHEIHFCQGERGVINCGNSTTQFHLTISDSATHK